LILRWLSKKTIDKQAENFLHWGRTQKFKCLMKLLYISSFTIWLSLLFGVDNTEKSPVITEDKSTTEIISYQREVNPNKEAFIADFDAQARKLLKRINQPGAAIAIVMDSTVVYTEGYGYTNKKTKQKVNENSVFRIGSLSKGFASILSGILVHQDKLNFDDKVSSHFPDFKLCDKSCSDALEVQHILSHSSGLPYHAYTDMVEKGRSMTMIKEKLGNLELIGKPGEIYSYQNAAYSVIEDVLEGATNKEYNELLSSEIFGPLGMHDASSTREDIRSCDNVALPHYHNKRGWRPSKISSKYYNATSAGGVNASVSDMSKWLQLLLGQNDDIISDQVLSEVFTPVVNAKNRKKYFQRWKGIKNAHYALGWRILEKKDGEGDLVYHGGYVNQYRSEIAVNRKENIAICVLSNAPTRFAAKSIPAFFDLYESYREDIELWEEMNKPTKISNTEKEAS